jgi:hypothetical protein
VSRRNHKELWEQLRVLILYSKQRRYSKKELYDLMFMLEVGQLAQDPLGEIAKITKEVTKK